MSDNPAGISTRDLKRRIRAMEEAVKDPETRETIPSAELRREIAAKQGKLSTTTDLHISDDNILGLTEEAKRRLFNDLFETACHKGKSYECGRYDPDNAPDAGHPYFLNGLWLTYKEAVASYSKWSNSNLLREKYWGADIRSNIPQPLRDVVNGENAFYGSTIEVVNLAYTSRGWVRFSQGCGVFRSCPSLRVVITPMEGVGYSELDFENCRNLEEVKILNHQKKSIYLKACPKLNPATFDWLIRNSRSAGFTVVVHKDVYAKLTGDTTNDAAAALTDQELAQWQQLLTDAAAKNILFATT